MAQVQEIPTNPRANVSLTGDHAVLLRKLQAKLQSDTPVNISLADVVVIALAKLNAELNK